MGLGAVTAHQSKTDLALLVIVPRDNPSRADALSRALAGTDIRVIVDRRRGERRSTYRAVPQERRHGDRRASARIVAYVYACPVVAVRPTPPPAPPDG